MPPIHGTIEAPDPAGLELVRRVPERGSDTFRLGMECVVQRSQVAAFLCDGQTLDLLGPGRHALSASKLPLLTSLLGLSQAEGKSFEAAIYFVSQCVFSRIRWNTETPVLFEDRELGRMGIWTSGSYTVRVTDPLLFLEDLAEAPEVHCTAQVETHLEETAVAGLGRVLDRRLTRVSDIPLLYNELATDVRLELREDFGRIGVDLIDFLITSVVPTKEVRRALDERGGANAANRLQTVLRTEPRGDAPPRGAEQGSPSRPGGMVLPRALHRAQASAPTAACPVCGHASGELRRCRGCRSEIPLRARFCPDCGEEQDSQRSA